MSPSRGGIPLRVDADLCQLVVGTNLAVSENQEAVVHPHDVQALPSTCA